MGLGVGIGVGVPTVLLAFLAWRYPRRPASERWRAARVLRSSSAPAVYRKRLSEHWVWMAMPFSLGIPRLCQVKVAVREAPESTRYPREIPLKIHRGKWPSPCDSHRVLRKNSAWEIGDHLEACLKLWWRGDFSRKVAAHLVCIRKVQVSPKGHEIFSAEVLTTTSLEVAVRNTSRKS